MRWFQILDTQTGTKHNALASDIDGAMRDQANVAARGVAGRRGEVVDGTRYAIEGQTFDVAFRMEAPQGAQPSRSERAKSRPSYAGGYEVYADDWHRQFSGIAD